MSTGPEEHAEQRSAATPDATGPGSDDASGGEGATTAPGPSAEAGTSGERGTSGEHAPLVEWHRTALRIRRSVLIVSAVVLVVWLVTGLLGDGPTLQGLGGWAGVGMGALFVAEVVVVGGAAVRGMLRAGERGERLAGDDVGLLPTFRRR